MEVTVKLFASARELVGQDEVCLELPVGATVEQLRRTLAEQFSQLRPLLPHALFAINAEYCSNDARVTDGTEIACIPPVSGG